MFNISLTFKFSQLQPVRHLDRRAGFIIILIALIFSPIFSGIGLAEENQPASADIGSLPAPLPQDSGAALVAAPQAESDQLITLPAPLSLETGTPVLQLEAETAADPTVPGDALTPAEVDNPAEEDVPEDNQDQPAQPAEEDVPDDQYNGDNLLEANERSPISFAEQFKVDSLAGMANLHIPIKVPQGRKGIEPNLSLKYNSAAPNGWLGTGWSLEPGSIQRSIKFGVPHYNDNDTFVLIKSGSSEDLVNIGNNQYRPKIEGGFMKIEFINNAYWLATDKQGVKYYFGQTNDSRQYDPNHQDNIFRWSLDKIEDLQGNYLTVAYQKIANQLYPRFIDYTGNSLEETAPYARIEFELEADDRTDNIISNKNGFLVNTTKRLSKINVSVADVLDMHYQFSYGNVALTNRSVLNSVIQYDNSGENHLPTVDFVYQNPSLEFTDNNARWIGDMDDPNRTNQYFTGDFNGDGLTDIAVWQPHRNRVKVALSTGHSFTFGGGNEDPWIGDMDDPNLTNKYWTGDFNGDGLTDIAVWQPHRNRVKVALSTGHSFTFGGGNEDPWWGDLDDANSNNIYWAGDFNGDGLTDLAFWWANQQEVTVLLSTGHSFTNVNGRRWYGSLGNHIENNIYWNGDFNGDGLTDLAFWWWDQQEVTVLLSTGHSFTNVNGRRWYGNPGGAGAMTNDYLIGDFNGDGLTDLGFWWPEQSDVRVLLSTGLVPHLLSSIDNNVGATTQISYAPSTVYDNTGDDVASDLPFPVAVVSRVTVTEQTLNQSYVTDYDYKNGFYDAPDREFRGFAWIKKTDAAGNYTENDLLQDDIFQGRIAEQRNYDADDRLYNKTVNTWSSQNLHQGVDFAYLSKTDNYIFDGDESGRRKQVQYYYEEDPQYGNLTRTVELGEVDLASGDDLQRSDNRITGTEYLYNSDNWLVSLPKTNYIQDADNNVLKQLWLYYDNNDYDNAPNLGNLTRQESWLKTDANPEPVAGNSENPGTAFTYDAYGNLLSITDPIGNLTSQANDRTATIAYDSDYHLFPLTTANALGHRTQTAYYGINNVPLDDGTYHGLFGQVKSNTDANNVTSFNIYDGFGRLIKTIGPFDTPDLPTTFMEYDLANLPVKVITRSRIEHNQDQTLDSVTFYDGLGRAIQTKIPAEEDAEHDFIASASVAFNAQGQVEKQYLNFYTDSFNAYTVPENQAPYSQLTYDALGRITELTQPDESRINTAYQDWVTAAIDANGHLKKSYTDGFGQLITVKEYTGADGRDEHYPETQGAVDNHYTLYAATKYSYDILNNLTQVTDALGNRTIINFDSLNRKVATNDPDMGRWTYGYDLAGNLISQTDAEMHTIVWSYDDLNRVIAKQYFQIDVQAVGPPVTYVYDNENQHYAIGRLARVSDGWQSSSFSYDALGREISLLKQLDGALYKIGKNYDALGRLKTLIYPEGETLTYAYNAQGQLESLSNQNNYSYVQESDYDQNNQLTDILYGNNTKTSYIYNPLTLRLSRLVTQNNQNRVLQDLSYGYDSVRNIISLGDDVNGATQDFIYDPLNRLISADNPVYGFKTYSYNKIGNLLEQNEIVYTYGQGLQAGPHAVVSLSDGTAFAYDRNGNLVNQLGALNYVYQYDSENRLTGISKNNQNLAVFQYDGQGNRTKKTIYQRPVNEVPEAVATVYVGDLYEKTGNAGTNHIFFGKARIASVIDDEKNYFHVNQLGSTEVMTNSLGEQMAHYEYLPHGSLVVNEDGNATRYKFTGKEFDDETGLYYYGARYYNPAIGRFITPDTMVQDFSNPQTLNRYSYVNNNPVNYVDPTGHESSIVSAWASTLALITNNSIINPGSSNSSTALPPALANSINSLEKSFSGSEKNNETNNNMINWASSNEAATSYTGETDKSAAKNNPDLQMLNSGETVIMSSPPGAATSAGKSTGQDAWSDFLQSFNDWKNETVQEYFYSGLTVSGTTPIGGVTGEATLTAKGEITLNVKPSFGAKGGVSYTIIAVKVGKNEGFFTALSVALVPFIGPEGQFSLDRQGNPEVRLGLAVGGHAGMAISPGYSMDVINPHK